MRNVLTLKKTDGRPDTGKAVEAYLWQSTTPFYSSKIGDFIEITGLGQYYIELSNAVRATILVNSTRLEAFTGVLLDGDLGPVTIPDGSITTVKLADGAITTPKIADSAVTPPKTTFVENY